MSDTQRIDSLIAQALEQIAERMAHNSLSSTRLVDVKYITHDLGVSRMMFHNDLLKKMPFMFRLTPGGSYKARLCDYEQWKSDLINNPKTT